MHVLDGCILFDALNSEANGIMITEIQGMVIYFQCFLVIIIFGNVVHCVATFMCWYINEQLEIF